VAQKILYCSVRHLKRHPRETDLTLEEFAEVAWAGEVWENQITEIVKAVMSVLAKRTL
jgi:hypothetical protein